MGTISYLNIHIEIRCVKGRVNRILGILFSTFLNKAVEHTQLCVPNSNLKKKFNSRVFTYCVDVFNKAKYFGI